MRYLVTGGAGFLGSNLVKRLAADGHEVRVLDDMSRGRPERLTGVNCEVFQGDVRSPLAVYSAMTGCDAVAHLAYLQGTANFYSDPRQVLDVAVRGMVSVLDACETTGCRELMLVSTSEAYQVASIVPTPETVPLVVPDPLNPRYSYGGGKIISELMALTWQRAGVLDRVTVVRPHNVYGPDGGREHVIPEFCIRMNSLVREYPSGAVPFSIQGSGLETRSFVYIDDCIDQLVLLLQRAEPTGIYHVGNPDERTVADVARSVAACYLRDIKVAVSALSEGSPVRRCPDISKIMMLGYPGPKVDFAQGLARTVEWYQANG